MQHIDTARPMFETAEQSNLSYAVKCEAKHPEQGIYASIYLQNNKERKEIT